MTSKIFLGSVAAITVGALGIVSLTLAGSPSAQTAKPWGALTMPASDGADQQAGATLGGVDKSKLLKLASYNEPQDKDKAPVAATIAPVADVAKPVGPATPEAVAPSETAAVPVAEPTTDLGADAPAPTVVASAEPEPKAVPAPVARLAPPSAVPSPKVRPGQGLDLNRASADALDQLPGVGRIGRAIVGHRPYRSIEDLVHKRVLRMSDFQKIRSKVRVD